VQAAPPTTAVEDPFWALCFTEKYMQMFLLVAENSAFDHGVRSHETRDSTHENLTFTLLSGKKKSFENMDFCSMKLHDIKLAW
jgi:hypothetical protein